MFTIGEGMNVSEPSPLGQVACKRHYYTEFVPEGVVNVNGYQRIVYPNVYDKIDMHLTSNKLGHKLYFVFHPGSDPSELMLQFDGHDSLSVDIWGDLLIYFRQRYIKLKEAVVYQDINGQIFSVSWGADYIDLNGQDQVGFYFGSYNQNYPLILQIGQQEPPPPPPSGNVPEWSTYFGDIDFDRVNDVHLAPNGLFYVCGATRSIDFPVSAGMVFDDDWSGATDGFYAAFSSDYTDLYVTYFGGGAGLK